jgi:carboxypeptidase family protein
VSRVRAPYCHYCPPWVTAIWLIAGIAALLYAGGCRRGVPAVDLGPKPPAARGTLTGLVHGPNDAALSGRTVEVVNVASGEKFTTQTATNGGFTIELPKGKYRLDLQLRDGETLVRRPGVVDLDRGDIDSHIEFVVNPARSARRPSYRLDSGLGSPVASAVTPRSARVV